MSLAALASAIVALCKSSELAMQLVKMVAAGISKHEHAQAYADIDADRARITAQHWVCPRTCPHRGLHEPQPTPPPAGHA